MRRSYPIPIVFLCNFIISLLFISFFTGLSIQYHCIIEKNNVLQVLGWHIAKAACFTIPITITGAAISIYVFLLRHHEQLILELLFFILCLVVAVFVIIPFFYEFLPLIEQKLDFFNLKTETNSGLLHFFYMPSEITRFITEIQIILFDLYAVYQQGYTYYLLFASTLYILLGSFFMVSIFANWNMLNFAILIILFRLGCFLYPYTKHHIFMQGLSIIHLQHNSVSISFIMLTVAVLLFTISTVLLLKRQKITRNKKKGR